MKNEFRHIVMTQCMTYNHAPYIVDAMNSFCMQETSFPVVTIIIDDASTDGEPEVIKKFLLDNFDLSNKEIVRKEETDDYYLVFGQHNTNKNCFFAVYFLKYNHYSIKKSKRPYFAEWENSAKYLAFCEGDDYWTDSLKLQKQVDFLESHPEYGLVHTQAQTYNQEKNTYREILGTPISSFEELLIHNDIATLTVIIRQCLMKQYHEDINPTQHGWKMGDYPTWLYCASKTKIHFINEVTAVYRILPNSASHSQDPWKLIDFAESAFQIKSYFAERLHVSSSIKKRIISRHEETLIYLYMRISFHNGYKKLKASHSLTLRQKVIISIKIIYSLFKNSYEV